MQQREEGGYTLIELVIVVTVLVVIAAIAVPASTQDTDKKLELAAAEFASAMRFARSEAIRTGEPHGFRQQVSTKSIRVFRLDQATSPATLVYDIYHPVDKQLYDVTITDDTLFYADSVSRNADYRGTCQKPANVYFDGNGSPWCADPDTILLERFEVELTLGTAVRTVKLDQLTGRVTVL